MSAHDALMRGVHAALLADPDVGAGVDDRVFDRVPDRARFPYLTYGAATVRAMDGEGVEQHEFTIDAWSRRRGRAELRAVVAAVRRALAPLRVAVAGQTLVAFDTVRVEFLDDEGEIERGTIALRAVTMPDTSEGGA